MVLFNISYLLLMMIITMLTLNRQGEGEGEGGGKLRAHERRTTRTPHVARVSFFVRILVPLIFSHHCPTLPFYATLYFTRDLFLSILILCILTLCILTIYILNIWPLF